MQREQEQAKTADRIRRKRAIVPMAITALVIGLWGMHGGRGAAANGSTKDATSQMPLVSPVAVVTMDVPVHLDALGTVVPRQAVVVHSQLDAQPLKRIFFREGQRVSAGMLLAEIEPRPYQIQLQQAQGQLLRDRQLLANARIDSQRYRMLLSQDSIAKQTADTQDALVHQYEGTVQADEAAVDNARLLLSYTQIKAPISGRLGLRQVDAGNLVHIGDPNGIVTITQIRPIDVVFSIPADNLSEILSVSKNSPRVLVQVWDRAEQKRLAEGFLLGIDNQVDVSTGTVRMKAAFSNEDNALFPNQFVNVRLQTALIKGARLVPTAALQHGRQGDYLYVVANGHASRRPVKVGPQLAASSVILDGVTEGELIVAEGIDRLRDGMSVRINTGTAPTGRKRSGG